MKDPETLDWRFFLFGPLGLIGLTLPFLVTLGHLTARSPQPAAARSWQAPLKNAEHALAEGNLGDAARAERQAYQAALTSGQWPGMIEVGDLRLRMNQGIAMRSTAEQAPVRQAYLIALARARRDGDLDGVLRAAEAFARLDDEETVERSLRIASVFAAHGSLEAQEMYEQTVLRLRSRGFATTPVKP